MTATQIRQRLETILNFMEPYWEFVNCHMVNYLTDKHWERFVPQELRAEVNSAQQAHECIERLFWNSNDGGGGSTNFAAIAEFIHKAKQQRLAHFNEILLTINDLKMKFDRETSQATNVSIKEFMTDKKRHEVEVTAALVHELIEQHIKSQTTEEVFIVDAGDGKGYLSSRLALQYRHKVLGIDVNAMNTENALKRNKKLQRAWNGLVTRAELLESGIQPPRRSKKPSQKPAVNNVQSQSSKTNYRTTARFIDVNLDVSALLREHFATLTTTPVYCLSGLHTCGDLASTCLRVFHAQANCKILCNIGCCYNFIKESYTTNAFEHSSPNDLGTEAGFPMSNFLHNKRIRLGRNARMLAAQCIERTLATKELPNITLFYRALLEVLIAAKQPELHNIEQSIQAGRIRKFTNFPDYVQQCAMKTNLEMLKSLKVESVLAMETQYAEQRAYLELFYLLRMLFAPILESLILLDRLLYLKESGYTRSYLVNAFDAVISPRHYAIIAFKN